MKDVIALNLKFIADPDYDPDYDVFLDYTDSAAMAFRIEVFDFVEFLKKTIKLKNTVRVGNLYDTPNQEFLLKAYKGFGKILNLDIENFFYLRDYITWMQFNTEQEIQLNELLNSIKSNQHQRNQPGAIRTKWL